MDITSIIQKCWKELKTPVELTDKLSADIEYKAKTLSKMNNEKISLELILLTIKKLIT